MDRPHDGDTGRAYHGEHLALPGYGENLPTLEIFSYDSLAEDAPKVINRPGFAHIAFEVDDVDAALEKVLQEGGSMLGELVKVKYNNADATFVYARDIEGNIIELQHWER